MTRNSKLVTVLLTYCYRIPAAGNKLQPSWLLAFVW